MKEGAVHIRVGSRVVQELERAVELVEGHLRSDELVERYATVDRSLYEVGQRASTLPPAERAPAPHATRHQLERTRRYLLGEGGCGVGRGWW